MHFVSCESFKTPKMIKMKKILQKSKCVHLSDKVPEEKLYSENFKSDIKQSKKIFERLECYNVILVFCVARHPSNQNYCTLVILAVNVFLDIG